MNCSCAKQPLNKDHAPLCKWIKFCSPQNNVSSIGVHHNCHYTVTSKLYPCLNPYTCTQDVFLHFANASTSLSPAPLCQTEEELVALGCQTIINPQSNTVTSVSVLMATALHTCQLLISLYIFIIIIASLLVVKLTTGCNV